MGTNEQNQHFAELRQKYAYTREIHKLDPQPRRYCMLAPRASAPRVTRCTLGKYWSRVFFRKRLRVVDRELAIQSLISFRCLYLGQIGCQGDGVSRQPGWGTQVIYDSIWEAAIRCSNKDCQVWMANSNVLSQKSGKIGCQTRVRQTI